MIYVKKMKNIISLICIVMTLASCSNTNSTNISSFEVDNNKNINEKDGFTNLNEYVAVNYVPGAYDDSIDLEFKILDSNYLVYYTLDGSAPAIMESDLYKKPIRLEKITSKNLDDYPLTTSVDGILEWDHEGKCVSDIYNNNIQRTGNYPLFQKQNVVTIRVIKKDTKETVFKRSLTYIIDDIDYKIPVVSLTMPYDDWFDEKTGMYNNIRKEVEKRVYLEYFDFVNDESFALNSKIKLGGNWTLGYPMRTLNLNFNKDENGNKNTPVNASIFGDRSTRGDASKKLKKLTRFRLHSGGNTFESHTGFNDAVLQGIMEDSNASTTGYRPCIGYLNGEYWGLYYIREHYSDTYFKDNYDVEKDDVIFYELKGDFIIDDGDEAVGKVLIKELLDYVNTKNFRDYNVYKTFIEEYIDEESFIDLFLAEAYASNWDFVGNWNNLKMWRTSKVDPSNPYADGKWRFCIHDVDFAFTEYTNFLDNNSANPYSRFAMFNNLLKQKEFRDKFYNRAKELVETNFEPTYASKVLNKMVYEVMPYKTNAMIRWGKSSADYNYWLNDVANTHKYFENKSRAFVATIEDSLKQFS